MSKIVAIVQARMGSTRLPCKMMLSLHGFPIIDWVVRRLRRSRLLDQVLVAVSENGLDDILVRHLEHQGVAVFRGPENDVLGRFCMASRMVRASHVIRVCADNPLIWGEEVDALIRHYQSLSPGDDLYAYNHIPLHNRYPDGLGAEMVSSGLLASLDRQASLPDHREHCLSFIRAYPGQFRISTFDPVNPALRRPDVKLDLDTAGDYRRMALMPLGIDMPPEDILALFPEGGRALP